MKLYTQLRYTDPFAPEGDPNGTYGWIYQKVLEKRYGFETLRVYYFPAHEGRDVDIEHLKRSLENNDMFPVNCFVMLNLEGVVWQPLTDYLAINDGMIEARMRILEIARQARPDCTFSYYAHPPSSDYEYALGVPDKWIEVLEASRPLVEMQDCLIPQFYFRDTVYDNHWKNPHLLTAEKAKQWASDVLETLSLVFPTAVVRPIMWPQSWTWMKLHYPAVSSETFVWTAEHILEMRVDIDIWNAVFGVVEKHCNSMILWGEGHCPWDPTAEWFVELIRSRSAGGIHGNTDQAGARSSITAAPPSGPGGG